jgi:hypothetical protein
LILKRVVGDPVPTLAQKQANLVRTRCFHAPGSDCRIAGPAHPHRA